MIDKLTIRELLKTLRQHLQPEIIASRWVPKGELYMVGSSEPIPDDFKTWTPDRQIGFALLFSDKIILNDEDYHWAMSQASNGDAIDRFENEGGSVE